MFCQNTHPSPAAFVVQNGKKNHCRCFGGSKCLNMKMVEQSVFLVCTGLITCCQMFNSFKDVKVLHASVLKLHYKLFSDRN